MSPSRRRTRGGYRPPRKRSEVLTAVGAVLAVLLVTAALIWFLRPQKSSSGGSNAPVSVPQASLPAQSTAPTPPPSQP